MFEAEVLGQEVYDKEYVNETYVNEKLAVDYLMFKFFLNFN